jgi:alpha,alpha-trehalase
VKLQAAIFDLDGVVTFTARLHRAAWRELFDAFLRARASETGEPFHPFTDEEYVAHVDGRPRLEGIRTFLTSRGITLPEVVPPERPEAASVASLAARKNEIFHALLTREGVDVDAGAVAFIQALKANGVRVGVASSSKNAPLVLARAGLEDLFEARIDGQISEQLGLPGKPEPDIFLACLKELDGAMPGQALVVEDAVAGVEAARRGGFGLVIGVDRGSYGASLTEHGADWVITDFSELSLARVEDYFRTKGG